LLVGFRGFTSRARAGSGRAAMRVLLLCLAVGAGATELTSDNWDAETKGKSVFIKFLAPW